MNFYIFNFEAPLMPLLTPKMTPQCSNPTIVISYLTNSKENPTKKLLWYLRLFIENQFQLIPIVTMKVKIIIVLIVTPTAVTPAPTLMTLQIPTLFIWQYIQSHRFITSMNSISNKLVHFCVNGSMRGLKLYNIWVRVVPTNRS